MYVVRTSVPAAELDAQGTVRGYKGLSAVERASRSLGLKVRPIHHYAPERVRAQDFVCMLAYYVRWHIRRFLAPLLFDDHEPHNSERASVVAPARRSPAAREKAQTKRPATDLPVHALRTLFDDLATIAKNRVAPRIPGPEPFDLITRPTELQRQALRLLGVRL